jgi:1-acyl-sn-glycerol-3-phosphate acyltransferase
VDERFYHAMRRLAIILFRIFFGLRVEGLENVPRTGGVIVACNHISELDPPVLGASFPRPLNYMAKRELFRTRLGSIFFHRVKAFPVDRTGVDRTAIRSAVHLLEAGEAVAIFPEGTRSRNGRQLPPKRGLGLIAERSGARILPGFVWGTDRPFRAFMRRPRVSVLFGRAISGEEIAQVSGTGGYEGVSRLAMERIAGLGADAGLLTRSEEEL